MMSMITIKEQCDNAWKMINSGDLIGAEHVANAMLTDLGKNPEKNDDLFRIYDVLAFAYIYRGMPKDALEYAFIMSDIADFLQNPSYQFKSNNILCLLHQEMSLIDKALEYGDKAYRLANESGNKQNLSTITGNLGLIYSSASNDQLALTYLFEAEQTAKALDWKDHLATIYGNIANVFSKHADYVRSLEYFQYSLEIHEANNNVKEKGRVLGNLAVVYLALSDFPRAISYFEQALEIHEAVDYKRGVLSWAAGLGDSYKDVGDFTASMKYYNKVIEVNKDVDDKAMEAKIYNSLGDLALLVGTYEDAFLKYSCSLQLFNTIYSKQGMLETTISLASLYSNPLASYYHPEKAIDMLNESIAICKTLQLKASEMNCYKILAELYEYLKDWENTTTFYKQYFILKDEIYSRDAEERANNFDFQRITDKAEKEKHIELARLREKENLLHDILPSGIADRIVLGEKTIADFKDNVSVIFMDIVGFTPISQALSAEIIVETLNSLYSKFDDIAQTFGIEKIKTIGDAYMAACGILDDDLEHKEKMVAFAFSALDIAQSISFADTYPIALRIGIHSGKVMAGIIGNKRFTFDIWGDTVNVAARLEQSSEANKIHVSHDFISNFIEHNPYLQCKAISRGDINIKGKGQLETYFLQKME